MVVTLILCIYLYYLFTIIMPKVNHERMIKYCCLPTNKLVLCSGYAMHTCAPAALSPHYKNAKSLIRQVRTVIR